MCGKHYGPNFSIFKENYGIFIPFPGVDPGEGGWGSPLIPGFEALKLNIFWSYLILLYFFQKSSSLALLNI